MSFHNHYVHVILLPDQMKMKYCNIANINFLQLKPCGRFNGVSTSRTVPTVYGQKAFLVYSTLKKMRDYKRKVKCFDLFSRSLDKLTCRHLYKKSFSTFQKLNLQICILYLVLSTYKSIICTHMCDNTTRQKSYNHYLTHCACAKEFVVYI